MMYQNSKESTGEIMWAYPASWLVRVPDGYENYYGHGVTDTLEDGTEVAVFHKDFRERYVDPQDGEGVIRIPNHSVALYRKNNELVMTVERAVLDWPGFEKRWTVKEGQSWLDYIPGWIRQYFERG